ncbi:MAG TPA: APC family permease [Anaerolineales bacterium]|nr:APC family permease [Anaerolineales bacterium]
MLTPENDQTEIMRRQSDYAPPRSLSHWFIGRPLSTADAPHQTIGKAVGLAVFASDALSSTAYATQEILGVLAVAGAMAYDFVFPISIAIVALLAIVTISYEQTIHAYPGGGGAYIVSRDNLGESQAQVAGAALLMDYILTVAVSISAGVAQIVSAYPSLDDLRVEIAVGAVFIIMLINLRGVKESGKAFAVPTYFFVVMMFTTVGIGLFRYFTGSLGTVVDPPEVHLVHTVAPFTAFLLLHAFANGTTALTGVEAISNGITAFREPRSRNAGITLIWMSMILGTLFLSISYLTGKIAGVYSEDETIISQLTRTIFDGRGSMYLATITATTVILLMAANTAFADFPRLSALAAGDGFLPRQLTFRGSRLVYSNGIVTLSVIASILIIIFKASVTSLIPLYAIGVFLSFTLSQTGMARRWWKIGQLREDEQRIEPGSVLRHDKGWRFKMFVNGFGALCTAIVMVVFAVTKFAEGAWVVLILIPLLVAMFFTIHHHYKDLASHLTLDKFSGLPARRTRHRVILPVSGIHQGALEALRYAKLLSDDVTAIHVSIDPAEAEKVQKKWKIWGEGTRLIILDSPFRLFIEPLLEYIEEIIDNRQPNETITIVVPQFIPSKRWHQALHMRTADFLRQELLSKPGVVVTDVPYQVREEQKESVL